MKALVLVVNGLPCGPIGAYGNDWVGTPAFDRLAAEGVVFDQHFSECPEATAARRTWRHGRVHLPGNDAPPENRDFDLFAALRAAGATTILLADTVPHPAFAAGWDEVRSPDPGDEPPTLETMLEVLGEVLDEFEKTPHWLVWFELTTLMPPWRFPEDFFEVIDESEMVEPGEEESEAVEPLTPLPDPEVGPLGDDPEETTFLRLQETFAAAVRYVDAGLEHVLEGLEDDVLLLVTSDRGTVLGEHGMVGAHRPWLHEELVHLPLLARLPGGQSAGRRVSALTQSADLIPTLLDCFGVAVPPELHGHSLVPFLHGREAPVREYAVTGLRIGQAIEWSLRTLEWAFLLPIQGEIEDPLRPPQLYAKPEDRWEVNNLHQHHQEWCDTLTQLLAAYDRAARTSGPLTPPQLPAPNAAGPDPSVGQEPSGLC